MEIKLLWLLHFLEFAEFSAVTERKESQHYKSEETKIFLFLQKFGTIFSWFSMIRSLGFSLHLMDSSLSWFFLVSCLLCTESIFFFFIAMISFLFVYLFITWVYAKLLSFLLADFQFRSHLSLGLFYSEESFLSFTAFFSPVLILAPPVGYTYIIHSVCFSIYSKMRVVLSFRWALYSHSKSIFCSLCSLSLLSL